MTLRQTLKRVLIRHQDLTNRYGVRTALVIILIHTNLYRLLPVCECVPLSGDKFWYIGYLISLLIILQYLFLNTYNIIDHSLTVGLLSITVNDLFDELIGNPHKVEIFEIIIYGLVAFIVCHKIKLAWYWRLLIIGSIVGLGLI